MKTRWLWPSLLLLLSVLSGCGRETPLTPEQQIRALLDRAEAAVEARDLSAATELISSHYSDDSGRNRHEMRRMLAGYFLRHKSIHLLKQVEQITLSSETTARAVLFIGMVGSQAGAVDSISQWRGDLVRLEVQLLREADAQWRLHQASWRRASRGELL